MYESKSADIRSAVGEALNPEILICKPQEFQAHYLPSLPPRYQKTDLDQIKTRLGRKFFPEEPSKSKENKAETFKALVKLFLAIQSRNYYSAKGRNTHEFLLVPNTSIESDVNGANFRIDSYIGQKPGAGNGLHTTDIMVPMELKKYRRDKDIRQVSHVST